MSQRYSSVRRWAPACVAAAILVDAGLAVYADAGLPGADAWLVLADAAVGLAFALAAWWAVGPLPQRWLVAAVGIAWLAGLWLPAARSLHQGPLVVALVAFPEGRLHGFLRWLVVASAAVAGLGVMSQIGDAAVFGVVAALALVRPRRTSIARWYPVAVASAGRAPTTTGPATRRDRGHPRRGELPKVRRLGRGGSRCRPIRMPPG